MLTEHSSSMLGPAMPGDDNTRKGWDQSPALAEAVLGKVASAGACS
jgi:hypothetical protein